MSGIIKGQSGQPIQFETTPNVNGDDVLTRPDIVGTVSESGGVPTGAIIQRGSNANGEFVRYADGTQICTYRNDNIDVNLNEDRGDGWALGLFGDFTFPSAFTITPSFIGTTCDRTANGFPTFSTQPNLTQWRSLRLMSKNSTGTLTGRRISLIAIGRWY